MGRDYILLRREEAARDRPTRQLGPRAWQCATTRNTRYSRQRPAVGYRGVAATGRRREPSSDSAARGTVAHGLDLFVIKRAPAADRSAGSAVETRRPGE